MTADLAAVSTNAATPGVAALAALDRLGDVLARENAALRARDRRTLETLAAEKRAAVDECARLLAFAANAPDASSDEAGSAADAVRRARSRLAALMEENRWRLRVAIEANRRLVETIASAAQAQAAGGSAYASDGRNDAGRGRKTNPPALTFSRAL
ncbi:MAG: hypothetical protein JNM75_09260 [Rhodospirillales bacterium]|nr:hypothetical protein [Rhodospirillales bacterium]